MIRERLGHFEITAKLGAGGMGEVWRARDTRLGREVAVKVLPEELAGDPERLRRFEQEARAASSLNHPNLLTLYDVGSHEGRPYLVTEVLEGRSLRDVLVAEGKVPQARALDWSAQVARGLAAAHAAGIVHRDLKPENLFVCADGRMKILDFGLAKLTLAGGGSRSVLQEASTVTELTHEGMLLGTVGYMAPEQVRGEAVDARADLFALGCVLIEMLTGERAFRGASTIDTLSAILNSEPRALTVGSALELTPALSRLVARCLAKDAASRWQCAGDLGAELERLAHEPSFAAADAGTAASTPRRGRIAALPLAAAALVVGLAIGLLLRGGGRAGGGEESGTLTRFALEPPAAHTFSDYTVYGAPAASPDGRSIVFSAGDAAESTLWLQRLDAASATELAGTADGSEPFWSPNGAEVGFFADGKLKRIVLATGAVHVVCGAPAHLGGTWTSGGTILFAPGPGEPIWGVAAHGGAAAPVTRLAQGEFAHLWPEALPGDQRFLFQALAFPSEDPLASGSRRLRAATVDGKTLECAELEDSSRVEFVAPDLLVFVNSHALQARRFDPESLRFEGEPAVLAEPVAGLVSRGDAPFAAAPGVLLYLAATERNALIWYDRQGHRLGTVAEPGTLWTFSLSSDDSTALYARVDVDSGAQRIWRADTERGTAVPITQGPSWSWAPIFAPDDRRMVFESTRLGPPDPFVQELSPGSEARLLRDLEGFEYPVDWAPDGSRILLVQRFSSAPFGIWTIDPAGTRAPEPLVTDLGEASGARVAPTGDLLAVSAKVSDRWDIYVQRYPQGDHRILASAAGGVQPTWRRDGAELYYLGLDSYLYAVPLVRRPRLDAGAPERLFHVPLQGPLSLNQYYQPAHDGRRFLVNALVEGRGAPAQVVFGWQSLLQEH